MDCTSLWRSLGIKLARCLDVKGRTPHVLLPALACIQAFGMTQRILRLFVCSISSSFEENGRSRKMMYMKRDRRQPSTNFDKYV
jgi:hypothetical protein